MGYAIMWEYSVPARNAALFESAYGGDGPWAALFRRAPGFIAVELLRCEATSGRYVTIDRWTTKDAFDAFRQRYAAEYEVLDAQLDGLAEAETRLGGFTL